MTDENESYGIPSNWAQPLFVGQPCHYVSYGTPGGEYSQQCRAATITEVNSQGGVDGMTPRRALVAVFNPTGLFFQIEPIAEVTSGDHGGTFHLVDQFGRCFRSEAAGD